MRFEIENSGKTFMAFETEARIKDAENPDATIIIKSGYTTLKETDEYADVIVNMLNSYAPKPDNQALWDSLIKPMDI